MLKIIATCVMCGNPIYGKEEIRENEKVVVKRSCNCKPEVKTETHEHYTITYPQYTYPPVYFQPFYNPSFAPYVGTQTTASSVPDSGILNYNTNQYDFTVDYNLPPLSLEMLNMQLKANTNCNLDEYYLKHAA